MRTGLLKIRTISLILASLIMFASCDEARVAPELVEPLTDTKSFRPVERMDVGNLKVEIGTVVPTPYIHFFERQTTIKEISCDIGQDVNEGDVLAIADIEQLKEELTETRADYELLVALHDAKAPIYELNQRILAQQRQECFYRTDEDGAMQFTTEIKKGEEDHTYDEELHAYMVDYYNREIADIEKTISEGTLRAKKSGYVTYIKDTSKGSTAAKDEAIVIVSDYDDTYIEVPDTNTATNKYKKYEVKYAIIGGKRIPVEEMEYSQHEQVYANAKNIYPNVRYKTTEPVDVKIGDTVILCYIMNDKRDVLAIGFDSTNADEEGNYVYVKKEDGSLEKRYIEIGVTDDCHYEVISGLSEGEEVYYTQEAYAPPRYEEYTVETGIQRTTVLAGNLKKAETVNTAYFAPCKGKIESINIDTNAEVKKGDVLLVIDSGSGEAAIQEVENDIKHLKMDHDKYNEDADKNIKTLTVQGLRLLTTIEEGKDHGTIDQTDEDCIGCQRAVFELRAKIAEVEKEASRIEYEAQLSRLNRRLAKLRKDNNGSGKISVVAKEDSIVSRLYVKEGDLVEPGKTNYLLLSCTRASEGMASVNLNKETILPGVGCNIEIDINEKDDKYFGTAVSCVSAGKAYAFTEGEKTTLSVAEGNGISGAKYIIFELEDKEFFDKVQIKDCETKVQTIYAENMIIVPGSVVYKEENQLTEKERFFVWKLVNGTPVKQYVIKGSTYGIGTDASVVILRGLEPGDTVAKESSAAGNTKEEQ